VHAYHRGVPSTAVVVPTKNRASSLRATLAALARVDVPTGWSAELVVVDNGSTDETRSVAAGGSIGGSPARTLSEPRPGVSRARNRGAAATTGDVLLFLDDDVRPPRNWLKDLAAPIVSGRAAATVSLFAAGEARDQRWMTDDDRGALVTEHSLDPEHPFLIGGSMAVARTSFVACGGFEHELGPGVLGSGGEDLLMTHQLETMGERIECVTSVVAEHWFDLTKLTPAALSERRAAGRRSEAWLAYHWFGRDPRPSRWKAPLCRVAAAVRGGSWDERFAWHDQMRIEAKRQRRFG
jgi:glycosyltransferase involved in cell wall biosynthesis